MSEPITGYEDVEERVTEVRKRQRLAERDAELFASHIYEGKLAPKRSLPRAILFGVVYTAVIAGLAFLLIVMAASIDQTLSTAVSYWLSRIR